MIITCVCLVRGKKFRERNNILARKLSIAGAIIGAVPMAWALVSIVILLGYYLFSSTVGVFLQERDEYVATGGIHSTGVCKGIHSSVLMPDTSLVSMDLGNYAGEIACAYAMYLHDNLAKPNTGSDIARYLPKGFLSKAFKGHEAHITLEAIQATEPYIFNVTPGRHCEKESLSDDIAISVWYREVASSRRSCSELVFHDVDPMKDPAGSWYSKIFEDYPLPGWLEYSDKN